MALFALQPGVVFPGVVFYRWYFLGSRGERRSASTPQRRKHRGAPWRRIGTSAAPKRSCNTGTQNHPYPLIFPPCLSNISKFYSLCYSFLLASHCWRAHASCVVHVLRRQRASWQRSVTLLGSLLESRYWWARRGWRVQGWKQCFWCCSKA